MDYLVVLFWSLVGSILSLAGGIILLKSSKKRATFIRFAMPFGAGAMLAAAMLGMLPEATHTLGVEATMPWVLGGFIAFFVLERALSWFHHHHHHGEEDQARDKAHTWLIVAGDTLHNAIDGVALGAAFVVSPGAGIGAALAILAHEVPQEISDFGLLLAKGMKPRRVVIVNIISALATVVTALLTYALGSASGFDVGPLLALAAGFFLYIAAADIIPDIHERPHKEAGQQITLLLLGVAIVASVIMSMPHDHSHGEHLHDHGLSHESSHGHTEERDDHDHEEHHDDHSH